MDEVGRFCSNELPTFTREQLFQNVFNILFVENSTDGFRGRWLVDGDVSDGY